MLSVDNLMCFKRNPFHDFKRVWSWISSWSGLSFQKSQCVHMRRRFMPATKVNRAIWSAPRVSGLLIPGECSYEGFRIIFFFFLVMHVGYLKNWFLCTSLLQVWFSWSNRFSSLSWGKNKWDLINFSHFITRGLDKSNYEIFDFHVPIRTILTLYVRQTWCGKLIKFRF